MEHVEVLDHSIHYLDWIRSILGDPSGANSHVVAHPNYPRLKDARNFIILAYDKPVRCSLSLNHTFCQGPRHQAAEIRVEGELGAAVVSLGLLLNYPKGEQETLEIVTKDVEWTEIPLGPMLFSGRFYRLHVQPAALLCGRGPLPRKFS